MRLYHKASYRDMITHSAVHRENSSIETISEEGNLKPWGVSATNEQQ